MIKTLPAVLTRAISPAARLVVKRDGSRVTFSLEKIIRAISLAWHEVNTRNLENPLRRDPLALYGLSGTDYAKVKKISKSVARILELHYRAGKHPTIEDVQDAVERAIAAAGFWDVAKAFLSYRLLHSERRLAKYGPSGLSDYIAMAKYARYREDLGRREVWTEAVERVQNMHLKFFAAQTGVRVADAAPADVKELAGKALPVLMEMVAGKTIADVIKESFAQVGKKRVLPSMRSMQFGGEAILVNHARLFNCAFTNVDRVEFFREFIYLLLSGSGVGYSVQKHHIALLPPFPSRAKDDDLPVVHHTIADTIEGWADSVHALFTAYLKGEFIQFDYSEIRPRGSALKTSGGRAPGHLPLLRAHEKVRAILQESSGRRLHSIEVYDACCFMARAVLSGGIRRSATICLFSPDDDDMRQAKTGDWFGKNPQRAASNNSAVIGRGAEHFDSFEKLFESQKEFGEPGFYFSDSKDAGANPCVEIGLSPVIDRPLSRKELANLYSYGYSGDLPGTTRLSGIQMCNLSSINCAQLVTDEDLLRAAVHAAVIGTLQAAYTHTAYLGPVTRVINEMDALLGVSLCGIMDNPRLLLNPELLTRAARLVQAANRMVAAAIGINPAARTTCVKPEGTASLLLDAASGIHPHHARYYIRRVTANRDEPIANYFKTINPQQSEFSVYNPGRDDSLMFPVKAPEGAMLRTDLGAVEFLDCVKLVQESWVVNGTNADNRDPDIKHNVSNTCTVAAGEWSAVRDFIWANRQSFTGISLLADDGDKKYPQSPREEVTTDADVARWNHLDPRPVDYTEMAEKTDRTSLRETVACAGGACDLT